MLTWLRSLSAIVFLKQPLCGEEGAVSRHTGFVHLLTAVEYCKYVYKSSGGFQRDSKGFVSQT